MNIEQELYNYTYYKFAITNLELQIENIKNKYTGVKSISYASNKCTTNTIISSIENDTFSKITDIEECQRKLQSYKWLAKRVDTYLALLDKVQLSVVEQLYFKGRKLPEVALDMRYSSKQIRRIKRSIFERFQQINEVIL